MMDSSDQDFIDHFDDRNQGSNQALKAFVGGLAPTTTEEQLKEYFGQFGTIGEVSVMREKTTGRSRGFAFLTYENLESLEKSLVSPKHQLDGRTVEVKRAIPRGEVKTKSRKVFVGGVPPNTTNETLRECFEKFGPIAEAQIMKDRVRGRSRGFGFVTFEDDESVPKVLSVSEHRLDGKLVDVKKAEPKKANVPQLAVGQAVAHLHASPNSRPRGSLGFAPVLNPYAPFAFVPYQVVNGEGFSSLGFTTPGYADANYLFPSPYTSPRGSFTVGENDLPQDFEILSMGRRFSHEFSGLSINPGMGGMGGGGGPGGGGGNVVGIGPSSLLSPVQAPMPIGQQHIPLSHQQQPPQSLQYLPQQTQQPLQLSQTTPNAQQVSNQNQTSSSQSQTSNPIAGPNVPPTTSQTSSSPSSSSIPETYSY